MAVQELLHVPLHQFYRRWPIHHIPSPPTTPTLDSPLTPPHSNGNSPPHNMEVSINAKIINNEIVDEQ